MANTGTIAAARECKSQCLAEGKAKGIAVPTKSSSPLSVLSLSDSEQPLHFPDSPTPMATPLDNDELPSSIPLPPTGLKHKSGSGDLSDASDSVPEPANKKWRRLPKAQSDSEVEEVVKKPPKENPEPSPSSRLCQRRKRRELLSGMAIIISHCLDGHKATSEGSQRLSIETTMSFEDALELIHETIGCSMHAAERASRVSKEIMDVLLEPFHKTFG
ncbi:hypothetical protein B0H17DRAFT_1125009 [Mycena rosella]|uniref:Uncharacterized protein n=1 Tax=Mycena rosella TaxID=1033263 RepID=A0AAD7GZ27_MYCRO|nr:hypothetical protein B0H17DRAFT_1125009 [Mycena rosella]